MADNDLAKLSRLLLRALHKACYGTHAERTRDLTEAGYLLKDLGWPDIDHQIRDGDFRYPVNLNTRGMLEPA